MNELDIRHKIQSRRAMALFYHADFVVDTEDFAWISLRVLGNEEIRRRWEISKLMEEEFRITYEELQQVQLQIAGRDYDHYREDDSPKGETIPGVRYRPAYHRLRKASAFMPGI